MAASKRPIAGVTAPGGRGDLRSLLIADVWVQGGHQHQPIIKMLSDAHFIGP